MGLANISKAENFFVEGSGTAHILGDDNTLSLIHLQDMTLELTSTMENIYGGEGNFALYSYNTEKGLKVTFTNASWNLDMLNLTQGVSSNSVTSVFREETVVVAGTGSTLGVGAVKFSKHGNVDFSSPITLYQSDNTVAFAWDGESVVAGEGTLQTVGSGTHDLKLPTAYSGTTLTAIYNYNLSNASTDSMTGVSSSLYTTGVPGFVTIYHKSKPMKQKNGRIIRLFTTIYRARCDGHLTMDFKHKNAFAPELAFEVVDPERADQKYMTFGIIDTTTLDKKNRNTVIGF